MKINYEGTFPQAPDMPLRARLGWEYLFGTERPDWACVHTTDGMWIVTDEACDLDNARVVVIDTIGAYSSEALLTGLVCLPRLKTVNQMIKLAQKNNCAVILTGLTKKRRKTESEYKRSYFDMDVLSAARSILQLEQKEGTPNIYTLRQIKNNLAPEGEDIPFLIRSSGSIDWLCGPKETEQVRLPRRTVLYGPCEIDELLLSRRLIRNLKQAGMDTFDKILSIEDKAAFLRIRNIGEKGYLQTIEALEARGMDVSHLK